MNYRLKSYDVIPPGGYPYVQTDGIRRVFPSMPMIEEQARVVAAFRKGNGLARASALESLVDVDSYTCARLGFSAVFCVPTDSDSLAEWLMNPPRGCRSCGAPIAV